MSYQTVSQLPDAVRDNLPRHAQAICKEAFNHAWDAYADADRRAATHRARRRRTRWRGRR